MKFVCREAKYGRTGNAEYDRSRGEGARTKTDIKNRRGEISVKIQQRKIDECASAMSLKECTLTARVSCELNRPGWHSGDPILFAT